MEEQDFCRGCAQRDHCQQVYDKLGCSDSAPVTLKVVVAFLLPLVVFIVCLGTFKLFFNALDVSARLGTGLGIVLALMATLAYILVATRMIGWAGKSR